MDRPDRIFEVAFEGKATVKVDEGAMRFYHPEPAMEVAAEVAREMLGNDLEYTIKTVREIG